jgi:site-specific DNA recombinase
MPISLSRQLRIVAYVRMSSERQEDSPERQREQIESYALKQGYRIHEAYIDKGLAGDDHSRSEFVRLLSDAKAGKIDVILVDEPSRLSRSSPLQFIAEVIYPLEQKNVSIESVSTGRLSWDDLGGLIMTVVYADRSRSEVRNMSRRVLDGMARSARNSWRNAGPPLGYVLKEERDPVNPRKIISRRLAPGDAKQIEAVKWMFAAYAKGKLGLRTIAIKLSLMGIISSSPNGNNAGRPFTPSAISSMLRNPAYVGDLAWNRKSQGKYCKLIDGKAQFHSKPGINPESEWIIVPNCHPPLVKRSTFQAVKDRLNSNPKRVPLDRPKDPYKMAKLLICGHCNRGMYGFYREGKSGSAKKYACLTHKMYGKMHCQANSVHESTLVKLVTSSIQETLSNPDFQMAQSTKQMMSKLWKMLAILERGTAAQVRAVFGELFDRITLHFDRQVLNKVVRTSLRSGVIFVKYSDVSNPAEPMLRISFSTTLKP